MENQFIKGLARIEFGKYTSFHDWIFWTMKRPEKRTYEQHDKIFNTTEYKEGNDLDYEQLLSWRCRK